MRKRPAFSQGGMGLLLLLLCAPAAWGQWGDRVLRLSESLAWGPYHDVEVQGNRAYCAMAYGLAVFDVTLPSQLQQLSVFGVPGLTEGVFLAGNYAYLASGNAGIQILDVSNSYAPQFISDLSSPGYAYNLARGGAYLFLADGSAGLRVINVANIADPVEVASLSLGGWARGLYLDGDYLYVAAETAGLKVVNVANPSLPAIVGSYNTNGMALGVFKQDSLLYLADGPGGVLIFNVANPNQPVLRGQWATTGVAHEIRTQGSFAYVADDAPGLVILSVANPQLPYLVGQYDSPGLAWALAQSGTTLYMADDTKGLASIWVANPQAPALLDVYSLPGEVTSVGVTDDFAYAARGYLGKISIVNVANPEEVELIGDYTPAGEATNIVDLVIQGIYCYSSHLAQGVYFTNVSNPIVPVSAGRKNTEGEAENALPRYPYLYIADDWEGLVVVSIINPDSAWHVATTGWAKAVALQGDTAFVSQWDAGVAVVDISDPPNPQIVNEFNTTGLVHRCVYDDGLLYLADDNAGLTILTAGGALVGQYDTPGSTWDVKVSAHQAYLADAQGGLIVVDVSDPAHPQYAGSYQTPGQARQVFLDGQDIYVADQYDLGIYRFTGLSVGDAPTMQTPGTCDLTAFPNPFNSTAVIDVELAQPQSVEISVYNLAGEKLQAIFQGALSAGKHRFIWEAGIWPSGQYFVRMVSEQGLVNKAVTLIK